MPLTKIIIVTPRGITLLACGQPPQETPKNIRDQPIDGEFYVLSGILILIESVLFSYLVNSMQNQARSTSWALAIDRSIAIDWLATPAIGRYICAPPCPTLYGWSLVVTSASLECSRPTAIANKQWFNSQWAGQNGVCLINFDGSSANVTLFSFRKIFVLKSFWLAVNLFRNDIGPTYQSSDDSKGGPGWAMAPPEFWLAPCLPTPVFS